MDASTPVFHGCFVGTRHALSVGMPPRHHARHLPRLEARHTLVLVPLLAAAGCAGFLMFRVTESIEEQRVSASQIGPVLTMPITLDLEAETAARDTGPARHVYLETLTLSVTTTAEPPGDVDDLAFLQGAEIFIESSNPQSNLPRQRVAALAPIAEGDRTATFVADDVDIIEYAREGARLTATAEGTLPPDDVTFDGQYTLVLDAI